MASVDVEIGGRNFNVACQDGEEAYLRSAAKLLDIEASVLTSQIGRMPESQMLLMAGLMLADKTAGLEDQAHGFGAEKEELETRVAALEKQLSEALNRPQPEPEKIEVPVIPPQVEETMAELAARAEAVAASVNEKLG
ncbi:MAG: cell division protein ZapA [Pseudomonadota bacterium]